MLNKELIQIVCIEYFQYSTILEFHLNKTEYNIDDLNGGKLHIPSCWDKLPFLDTIHVCEQDLKAVPQFDTVLINCKQL